MSESSTVTQDGTKDGTDGISDEERRRHHHHHHHHPHHIEQEKLEIDVTKLNPDAFCKSLVNQFLDFM